MEQIRSIAAVALIVCVLLALACSPSESRPSLNVAAASDLQFALAEINEAFARKHPEIEVRATFGSSGNFQAQIANGAPFDVYFSADVEYPRRLAEEGFVDGSSLFVYAVGRIVVWVPKSSPLDVEALGVKALEDPRVRKIAIANPEHAPYGRAAVAALRSLGVHDAVNAKFVLGENVSQTAQFAQSGAADAGIIALSLAEAPSLKERGKYWLVPAEAHPKLEQAAVIVSASKNQDVAREYLEFVKSAEATAILKRFGFTREG